MASLQQRILDALKPHDNEDCTIDFNMLAVRRDNHSDVTKSKIAVVVYNNTTNSFLTIVSVQVAQAGLKKELDDKVDAMVFRTLKD
ncbi:hypothetical protein SLS59_008820 [Nothophoma quercina]|uniref:Uncharacterized protein n=1 Tax=Nothophoma quercina TaxID=749835 RepID=A0ABR3QQC3_9PLEO